jgi:TIR domain
MAVIRPDAFISYSREDAEFVDRLEADLRAREFDFWVDRRRIEGGREWEQEITRAIERYSLVIAVLSPPAVRSPNVRFERDEALRLAKRIVPVLYKVCPFPSALEKLQWIDFTDANTYARSLKELVYACQDLTFDLTADSNTLYNQALSLEESDPEHTAILFQRIVDRDPGYFGGQVANDLRRLEQRLYTSRAARLKAQAEQARQQGEYGVEAGALEAIVALGGQEVAMLAWAKEYLPVAQQNRALLGPYEVILQRIAADDHTGAAELLRVLWQQAPYFRDPAGVAPTLGLTVPMTYEEARDRRLADETRMKGETEATTERDSAIKDAHSTADAATKREDESWRSACELVKQAEQGNIAPEHRWIAWGSQADELTRSLIPLASQQKSVQEQLERADSSVSSFSFSLGGRLFYGAVIPGGLALVFTLGFAYYQHCVGPPNTYAYPVCVGPLEFSWTPTILSSILIPIFLGLWFAVLTYRASGLKSSHADQSRQIAKLANQWKALAEVEHTSRLSDVENESRQKVSAAREVYQRRMAEITAEHYRALAEITQRYV